VGHRTAVLAGATLTVLAASAVASGVRQDFGLEQFFPDRGPARDAYRTYKQTFPREDTQVALFWRESGGLTTESYSAMRKAADALVDAGLEDVTWIGAARVVEGREAAGGYELGLHPLIAEELPSAEDLRIALGRHRHDRLLDGILWSPDQRSFALYGYVPESQNNDPGRHAIERGLTERLELLRDRGRELVLTGIPIVRARVPVLLAKDQALFLGGGIAVLFAVLFVFFRRRGRNLLCVLSVLPGYVSALAVMRLTDVPVTILTAFIPIVVLVVGVSDSIHLLDSVRREQLAGRNGREAVLAALPPLLPACSYTALTAAAGFLSLVATRIDMVAAFGAFTALALGCTYLSTISVLPLLLTFGGGDPLRDHTRSWRIVGAVAEAALRATRRPPMPLVATVLAVTVAGACFATRVRVETRLVDDIRARSPIVRDLRWAEEAGFGLFQVNVLVERSGEAELHDPGTLRWMADLEEYLAGERSVVRTMGLPDVVAQVRAAVTGDSGGALPASPEEAGQLLFLAEMDGSLRVGDLYRADEGRAQVIALVRDDGSRALGPMLDRLEARLATVPPPGAHAQATGTVVLTQVFTTELLQSFGPSLVIEGIAIFAIMAFLLRSLWLGALALVPNLAPLLVLAGIMGLGGFAIKPSTILVCSIIFGILVDSTIHLIGRTREARRQGLSVPDAVREALEHCAPAVVITGMAVGAGFALLIGSQFEVLFLMGVLAVTAVVLALAADLFLLPALVTVAWAVPARLGHRLFRAFGESGP
jgi:uncharacterized protein